MRYLIAAAGGLVSAGIFAMPASASYMEKCSALIGAWTACQDSGGTCGAEQTAIEKQCKCHVQKGDDWKLVNAAVEKDGVCGDRPPEDVIIPPPPPPPSKPVVQRPHAAGDNQGKKGENAGRGDN